MKKPMENRTILVVDDDPSLLEMLAELLQKNDYEPIALPSGEAALEKLDELDPSVALIDIKMEEVSGIEVLQAIKNRKPDTICIMLTAYAAREVAIAAINLGAYSFFEKPYDPDQLLLTIRRGIEHYQAGVALQASEEKYRDLVENINEVIYTVDVNGIVTYISPIVESLGGYAPSELIGRPLTDFVYPDDLPDLMESFQKTITGQLEPFEYRIVDKSGQIHWARSSSRLIREDGQIVGLRGSLIDITKRKQTELTLRKRNRRIQSLYLASWQMGRTLEIEKIFENVYQIMAEALPCDSMVVSSYDEEEELIRCDWSIGPNGLMDVSKLPPLPLDPDGEGVQSKVISTGESFYFSDDQKQRQISEQKYYLKLGNELVEQGEQPEDGRVPQSALVVPLKLENRILGVIQVFSMELDAFTQDDLNFLEALSPQIATAMANARLYQQAQKEIKERQRAEEQLKAYSEQLEQRVQARTVQLQERVEEVERLNQAMVNLLSDLQKANTRLQQTSQQLAEANRQLADEHIAEQTALLNLSQTLLGEYEIESIADWVVSSAADVLGVELAALLLVDSARETYTPQATFGWPEESQNQQISLDPESAVGFVAREKQALCITDLRQDDFPAPAFVQEAGVRARLLVPVLYEEEAIGCLTVNQYQPHRWADNEVRLLTLIANSAAEALGRARLFEAESRRRQEAETLSEATSVLVSTLELDDMLENILTKLENLIPFDSASVMLVERDGLEVVASKNLPNPDDVRGKRYPVDDALFREMQRTGQALILSDVQEVSHFRGWGGTNSIRAWMATPLMVRGDVIGYLTFDSQQPSVFGEQEAKLAQAFANQAAAAIQNARLYRQEIHRRQMAETTRQIAQVVSASLEIEVILTTLLEQLENVVAYDTVSVLVTSNRDQWEMAVSRGYDNEALVIQEAKNLTLKSPILEQMATDFQPVIIPDVRQCDDWIWIPGAEHVRSFMGIPLIARGRLVGVLMLDSVETDFYGQTDLETVQVLVQHVAQAIDNAILFEQVSENPGQSHLDGKHLEKVVHIPASFEAFGLDAALSSIFFFE